MNQPMQVRPGVLYRSAKPVRDPEYRRFIKLLAVCREHRRACHRCGKPNRMPSRAETSATRQKKAAA